MSAMNLVKTYTGLLTVALLLLVAAPGSRAAVSVEASVDTSAVLIGDIITYTVLVTSDAGDSVAAPPAGINLYSFTVRDYQRIDPHEIEGGAVQRGARYRIAAYRPGTYVIPPLPLAYRLSTGQTGELVTQPLTIEIRSMGIGEGDTLRDIHDPIVIPLTVQTWVWVVAGSLAAGLLGLVLYLYWRKKRDEAAKGEDGEPVVVDELAEFDKIPAAALIAEGRIPELYTLVSETLRRYIGRRYRIDAMEMTQYELTEAFAESHVSDADADLHLTFLARCDLVKFAKFVPPEDEITSLVDRARDLVRQTQMAPDEQDDVIEVDARSPGQEQPTDQQQETLAAAQEKLPVAGRDTIPERIPTDTVPERPVPETLPEIPDDVAARAAEAAEASETSSEREQDSKSRNDEADTDQDDRNNRKEADT